VDSGQIPGYSYGTREVLKSPVSVEEFALLKRTVSFGEEDERYLRLAEEVLADQLEEILDEWFGPHPHLAYYFSGPDGKVNADYVAAARKRTRQWILDTCNRPYDEAWLNYAHEIGLRHHRTKKNQTDQVSSVPHVPLRYMIAFIYPTVAIRPFLARKGHNPVEVQKMHEAWVKSLVLQAALWSYPYAKEGEW
jgi:hypothetical protein